MLGFGLQVVVDIISMIKSLASVMAKAENLVGASVRLYIHQRVQKVIQADLVPILHRVSKQKQKVRRVGGILKYHLAMGLFGNETAVLHYVLTVSWCRVLSCGPC